MLGAKYTTARRLAELSINLVIAKLGLDPRPCQTAWTPLIGGDIEHLPSFREQAQRRFADTVPPDVVQHLVEQYGREIDAVLGGPPDPAGAPVRLAQYLSVIYLLDYVNKKNQFTASSLERGIQ